MSERRKGKGKPKTREACRQVTKLEMEVGIQPKEVRVRHESIR